MLNGVCLLVNSCLKGKDGRDFCIALWLGTKNGFITIIPSAENHGEFPAMLPRRRPNIHGSKVMLCIWWDQLGVVYYELLKPTETITDDRYQTQLMRLSRALKDKRPQYNERHDKVICSMTMLDPMLRKWTYLETLKWEVLPAVFSRRCSLWLSLVSINDTRSSWPALPVLWRSKKLDRFVHSFKRWPVFSTRDSYATRKMGESNGQRWTILWIINV